MTIDYHITIGQQLTAGQKREVELIIEQVFFEIDQIFNKWNPNSEISIINRLPASILHPISPQLLAFLEKINRLVILSERRFDPTIEPLQKLWIGYLEKGQEPPLEKIESLKPSIGWNNILIEEGALRKLDERTQLDFGGVAKGLCVDMLVERLFQAGYPHLYVEWGGEIRACGNHPSNRPWHIYISSPSDSDPSKAIAFLDLQDQALATSGDYYQYWTIIDKNGKQKRVCHIFNPLTLAPMETKKGSVASASLLAHDCVTADALAKVLMLFNSPEEAEQWIGKLQAEEVVLDYWIAVR